MTRGKPLIVAKPDKQPFAVVEHKGGYAVLLDGELITRTHDKQLALDYVARQPKES